jgi:uncharacterized protein with ParB-like and HNH nuclease domain
VGGEEIEVEIISFEGSGRKECWWRYESKEKKKKGFPERVRRWLGRKFRKAGRVKKIKGKKKRWKQREKAKESFPFFAIFFFSFFFFWFFPNLLRKSQKMTTPLQTFTKEDFWFVSS